MKPFSFFSRLFFLVAVSFSFLFPVFVFAQEEEAPQPIVVKNEYFRGKVLEILKDDVLDIAGFVQPYQDVRVEILDGADTGKVIEHQFQLPQSNTEANKLKVGEKVAVVKVIGRGEAEYFVAEKYRVPAVIYITLFFFLLAVYFGRKKGLSSIIGLAFSLFVIVRFVVPQIAAGRNPLLISIIGGLMILFFSLYLAHGFNKRTSVALVGTLISLTLSAIMAIAFVSFAKLFGLGSEDSLSLLQGQFQNINLRGLLLGGIIIGALGVLDDITTAQSAVVYELRCANPSLGFSELYKRGLSVGREHIASLINTLVLAYVGASLPLLLIFTKTDFPLWVMFNSEFLVEEIIRTLAGSATLIVAVPITTVLAAYVFGREDVTSLSGGGGHPHIHSH